MKASKVEEKKVRSKCSALKSSFNNDSGKFSYFCLRLKAEIVNPNLCSRCILTDKGKEEK
jgi:hypothetical protein